MLHASWLTEGPSTNVMPDPADETRQDETSLHEESKPEEEVFIYHPQPNMHQPVYTSIYVPYMEGPKMDWMVNDALYQRLLKWKLKCENILECEHPECQKCKEVIAWSGNIRMDQCVSWGLSKEEAGVGEGGSELLKI